MAAALHERHFFDKFIKMNIPDDYLDASRFRVIPDNQEVYVHKFEDKCLIIEILCFQNVNIQEKGNFYFYDLAKENDSVENIIITSNHSVSHSQGNYILLVGRQKIKKNNSSTYEPILLYLCIFPMEEHNADVLITWNVPKGNMDVHPELETFNEMVQSFRILDYSLFV
ncbi:Mog1-like protein [Plasmodium coatneyi]|uniref:Mog1-like protein n=1 Tax=Plasmodium coatneyi TaxID=208452 RepID=A0A1B1E5K8_9APIC|nr:Mog1-like protein [Plasmodium coatneyi]ANQ10288.1 Mog1-like protein [Plasmodium coatneyi]